MVVLSRIYTEVEPQNASLTGVRVMGLALPPEMAMKIIFDPVYYRDNQESVWHIVIMLFRFFFFFFTQIKLM